MPDPGSRADETFGVAFRSGGVDGDRLRVATDLRTELGGGLDPRAAVAAAVTVGPTDVRPLAPNGEE